MRQIANNIGAMVVTLGVALGACYGQTVGNITIFASGTAVSATGPDSLAKATDGTIWVSYTNGASSTGGSGSSTVVQYDVSGNIKNMFTIAGSVDGLKEDVKTGKMWALQNQDGNSTLTLIDVKTGVVGSAIPYAVESPTNGYDDVAFDGKATYLSYTNPVNATDPIIQAITSVTSPIPVTPILTMGATGTNLVTRQKNQPISAHDPDSLKLLDNGDLILTSGDDGQFIFVLNPGTSTQAVQFLQLIDSTGANVSGLDDGLVINSPKGIFLLADTTSNVVLAIPVSGITNGQLFASVGSLNALCTVDFKTGLATPLVPKLMGPHGLLFTATK